MLDLLKLAAPLEPIRFPHHPEGQSLRAVPLDAEGWAMLRRLQREPDSEGALALLQRCVPDATPDDLAVLAEEDVTKIILYCARKIRVVEDALGESSGEAGSPPPASPPTMTRSPSSPVSRARSGRRGSTSGASPTT